MTHRSTSDSETVARTEQRWQDSEGQRWPTRELGDGIVQLVSADYLNALEAERESLRELTRDASLVSNMPALYKEIEALEAAKSEAEMFLRERVDYIQGFEEEARLECVAAQTREQALKQALERIADRASMRWPDYEKKWGIDSKQGLQFTTPSEIAQAALAATPTQAGEQS